MEVESNQSSEEIMWRFLGNAAHKVGKRKNDAVLRQNLIDKYYFLIAACLRPAFLEAKQEVMLALSRLLCLVNALRTIHNINS